MNFSEIILNQFIKRATFEGWKIPERQLNDYELVLVVKGTGNISIENQTFHVEAGDLICFKPGIKHSLWLTTEPYMVFYGIHFSMPQESETLNIPDLMHLDAPMRLEGLFRSMHEIYGKKVYLEEWRKNLLLQQILCEVFLILHNQTEPINVIRIRKVLEYIQEHLYQPIHLDALLQQAGIGKTLFLQTFRSVTGTTPLQYITEQRLENAKVLLKETDFSVACIAEKCGFSDTFYFSRCFKKKYSQSPQKYRSPHTFK